MIVRKPHRIELTSEADLQDYLEVKRALMAQFIKR